MFSDNLIYLRKSKGLSQEELAGSLGITRQTLSKWENGESFPDIEKGQQLASYFGTTLDELVNYDGSEFGFPMPPKGKHIFGVVTVGDKGQIVIPAKARKIFDINFGDQLIVLGDENSGLALLKEKEFLDFANMIRG